MQQSTTGPRAPGSFSPLAPSQGHTQQQHQQRPNIRTVESSSSDESIQLPLGIRRSRPSEAPRARPPLLTRPSLQSFTSQPNTSTSSLQNFSRPNPPTPRNVSPLTAAPRPANIDFPRGHRRNNSQQGFFDPTVTSTASMANLNTTSSNNALSASQIAAQAAMQHQSMHQRQRSQTVPTPQTDGQAQGMRKGSRGPTSPPLLSLTEASGPKDNNFGGQVYHNGLLGGNTLSPAATAANVVFPKSPVSSPGLPPTDFGDVRMQPEKPITKEKSKVKLFSRPGKIGISKEKTPGALPSPNKMGSYTAGSFQRANASTNSLADSMSSAASMYSMANSSSATIRQVEASQPEISKDKEAKHKHHFLSRQKHKLSKEDHHLPLSSAASNSKPVDPSAPSSLYNFNLPPSPGPSTTSFAKSMSGLDLRHGGRALREKKKEEKSESALRESELSYQHNNDWPGPSSLGSAGGTSYLGTGGGSFGYAPSLYGGSDIQDLGKYGLNNMTPDDAWPFLKAKLLIIFEGEDLRLPVEDFNRLVSTHLSRCVQKRAPTLIVEDLRDLLHTGFSSLDQTLRRTPDDRLIPHLVEMWLFTFTSILPYMQAVFLPLDLEFSGHGPLLSPEAAREFWGALPGGSVPAGGALEVRRIVLTAYRDTVILPRFDTLKTIFSRLSLESLNLGIPIPPRTSSPDSRPATAMSLDPSLASYGSQTTTLLNGASGDSSGNRSRAISNVSDPSIAGLGISSERPFTPSSTNRPSFSSIDRAQRQANVEDSSKQLTETVGRMLQCMSVLSSVGTVAGLGPEGGVGDDDSQKKMEELSKGLKLNWLGRGRTGRNRRGLVGARVKREAVQTDGIAV